MFSATNRTRDLKHDRIPHPSSRSIGPSPALFQEQGATAELGQAESIALEFLRPTALKKRLGLLVTSTKEESGRVYRLAAGPGGKPA